MTIRKTLAAVRVAGVFTLGLVLIFAAAQKLLRPYQFLVSIYDMELIGPPYAKWVAMIVPGMELTLGAALLLRIALGGALSLAAALMGAFLLVQSWVIAKGLVVSCSCFGLTDQQMGAATLLRTGAFFVVTILLLLMERQHVKRRSAVGSAPA